MQIRDMIPWARRGAAPEPKPAEDHPLATLQHEMNRAFESFWNRAAPFGGVEAARAAAARCDVVETDGGIEVSVELPGMERDDIEVLMSDDAITIKGEKKVERKEDKKGYYVSERSYGSIYRSIPLPPGVDSARAEAAFRNGVLTVRLPQAADAKTKVRHIDVKAA